MGGGARFRSDDKKAKFIKHYKRQGIVESHDLIHPEETQHVEEDGHLLVYQAQYLDFCNDILFLHSVTENGKRNAYCIFRTDANNDYLTYF